MEQLVLTPEQHEVLGRLEAVLKEAKQQNIGFVYDLCDGSVTAYNNANSFEQYAGIHKEDDTDEKMDWDSASIIENISMDYFDSGMQDFYLKF